MLRRQGPPRVLKRDVWIAVVPLEAGRRISLKILWNF